MTDSLTPLLVVPQWDNPERITVRIDLFTGWTWIHFQRSQQQVFQMVESVTGPVDVIIDTTGSTAHPTDMFVRPQQLAAQRHPRIRHTAIVLNTHGKHMAFQLLVRLAPQSFQTWLITSTLDEARAVLAVKRL